jgi:hypothetical protein
MAHYIAMSGMHGCLPDWRWLAADERDAVEASVDMFSDLLTAETEGAFRRALADGGYASLAGTDAGADYVEIVSCDCDDPSQHEEF